MVKTCWSSNANVENVNNKRSFSYMLDLLDLLDVELLLEIDLHFISVSPWRTLPRSRLLRLQRDETVY